MGHFGAQNHHFRTFLQGNSTVTELHLERFFFNLHSIAEHILTENLLIIEILLQVMKLVQLQEKNLTDFSVSFLKLPC